MTYHVPYYPDWLVAADFNGDGKLDLAACGGNPSPFKDGGVAVLLGNGDGTFQRPQGFQVGINPVELVVADFNGDGKPDLATINEGSTISILPNTTTPWPGVPQTDPNPRR